MASSSSMTWSPSNNSATVKALLVHRLQSGEQPAHAVHPYYQPWKPAQGAPVAATNSPSSAPAPPPACPMHTGGGNGAGLSSSSSMSSSSSPSTLVKLNPLNNMPTLSQERAAAQKIALSTERTMSSIPRSQDSAAPGASPYDKPSACPVPHDQRNALATDGAAAAAAADQGAPKDANWEYPSPQQFYNALVRKGWETPEEHVEMMVLVHNFLNERAWREVLDWERDMGVDADKLTLARFQGRPGTLSPKARAFSWAAMVAPNKFNSEPPFDRHDWVVRRPAPTADGVADNGKGKEVRYVIDYYSAPDDPTTDEPVFFLDVRPALDSVEAAQARIRRTWREWREAHTDGPQPQPQP